MKKRTSKDPMSKFARCNLAGFKLRAAKLLSEKDLGWVTVVMAEDVEAHLAEHKCEPVGDTAMKVIKDLLKDPDLNLPQSLLHRMENLTKKP